MKGGYFIRLFCVKKICKQAKFYYQMHFFIANSVCKQNLRIYTFKLVIH